MRRRWVKKSELETPGAVIIAKGTPDAQDGSWIKVTITAAPGHGRIPTDAACPKCAAEGFIPRWHAGPCCTMNAEHLRHDCANCGYWTARSCSDNPTKASP